MNRKLLTCFLVVIMGWSASGVSSQDESRRRPSRPSHTEQDNRWSVRFGMGPSIPTQGIFTITGVVGSADGSVGPLLGGAVFYGIRESILLGLDLSWETHGTSDSGLDLGSLNTISFLPTIQYHFVEKDPLTVYGALSLGLNLNSFSESSNLTGVVTLNPSDTFAIKPAAGLSYMVSDHWAIGGEMGWKWNAGNVSNDLAITGVNFNASAFHLLFSAEYAF